MPAASEPSSRRLRAIIRAGCIALAAVLACAPAAAAQLPGFSRTCASALAPPWRCVGSLVPANLFERPAAVVSPDGTRFVHSRREGQSWHLWLLDARTGAERRLTQRPGHRDDPVWSPDGRLIAFLWEIPGPEGEPTRGIGVVDAATGEEWLAVSQADRTGIGTVAWTPGGRIVYHVWESVGITYDAPSNEPLFPPGNPGGWWTADARGGDRARLRLGSGERPVFSPAGDSIAYIGYGCSDDMGPSVVSAAAEGGEDRCIQLLSEVAAWGNRGRLAWPHADTLLYLGAAPNDSADHAYLVPADGTPPLRLDSLDDQVTGISVARDGSVVLSVYRQRSHIALLPPDGGVPVPLALPGDPDGLWAEWHPSGLELAFTAVPRGPWWSWHRAVLLRTALAHRGTPPRPMGRRREREALVTGTWSADGRHLATYTVRGIAAAYGVARALRTDTAVVTAGWADTSNIGGPPVWSADGTQLLVSTGSLRWGRQAEQPRWSLMWVRVDSVLRDPRAGWAGDYRRVPLEGFDGRAVWPRLSRDGAWIAFAAQPGAEGRGGVYVVAARGGPVRAVAEFPAGEMHTGPEWNARGDSLYFSSPDSSGIYQLRRVGRGGGAVQTLTSGAEHVLHPRLSPDGGTLAVTVLDVRAELWMLPSRFPPRATP